MPGVLCDIYTGEYTGISCSAGSYSMVADCQKQALISEIVEKIVREYQPKQIILFGSYAYGIPGDDSDLDLFIVKNTDKNPLDRWTEIKKILRETSKKVPISPLVYTEKEIAERESIKDFFLEEILRRGVVLYG
jgi:predicted nucleotidyltransferase